MTTPNRTRVILKLARRQAPLVLDTAKEVYNALDADKTTFPSPTPTLPAFLAQIQALETAQQATRTRTKGTADARNTKLEIVMTSLESERMYVQTLCDGSPEQAVAIATAAGMTIATRSVRSKPVLQATPGTQPGAVLLRANASLLAGTKGRKKALFQWQMSADGGKTWTLAAPTPLASTEIQGLTPLTTYMFRVCVTVSKVVGEWSQAVSILVR